MISVLQVLNPSTRTGPIRDLHAISTHYYSVLSVVAEHHRDSFGNACTYTYPPKLSNLKVIVLHWLVQPRLWRSNRRTSSSPSSLTILTCLPAGARYSVTLHAAVACVV